MLYNNAIVSSSPILKMPAAVPSGRLLCLICLDHYGRLLVVFNDTTITVSRDHTGFIQRARWPYNANINLAE